MDYKKILIEIQNRQLSTFCLVGDFKSKENIYLLPRKHRGLYWIWTNLSFETLQKIGTRQDTMEVPISHLVNQRKNLQYTSKISLQGFTIVYNGIGGYIKAPAAFGLRERIYQELNCNNKQTGTMNLLNRMNKNITNNNWAVSYFDFDHEDNKDIVKQFNNIENCYIENAKDLEKNWRIEFGTPILTRH